MPHKKFIPIRNIRYEVIIVCNIGFFGSFTQDMPIATCYTSTVPIMYAKATEKLLREKMKAYLGTFNVQFKVGRFRLHFDCKIEESSGRARRIPRKTVDKNAIMEKVVERALAKIDNKLMVFFAHAHKDFAGIELKMEHILRNNAPVTVDNKLATK